MAKQADGAFGGFRGKLGPIVGYQWNGIWCVRARPAAPKNPKSEKQTAHRELFKQEVQFASTMHWVISEGLDRTAHEAHMTAYNLFVKLNQQAFSLVDGNLQVDYSRLQVSAGGLAPVAFGPAQLDASGVLSVSFEPNPLHIRADKFDNIKLCLYCPEVGEGFVSNGDYRRTGNCRIVVPDWMMGHEIHLYGYARDTRGFCSASQYIGSLVAESGRAAQTAEPVADTDEPLHLAEATVDPATGEIIDSSPTPAKKAASQTSRPKRE